MVTGRSGLDGQHVHESVVVVYRLVKELAHSLGQAEEVTRALEKRRAIRSGENAIHTNVKVSILMDVDSILRNVSYLRRWGCE